VSAKVDGLGIMAVFTMESTALKKYRTPIARPINTAEGYDFYDRSFKHR